MPLRWSLAFGLFPRAVVEFFFLSSIIVFRRLEAFTSSSLEAGFMLGSSISEAFSSPAPDGSCTFVPEYKLRRTLVASPFDAWRMKRRLDACRKNRRWLESTGRVRRVCLVLWL